MRLSRLSEHVPKGTPKPKTEAFDPEALLAVVEEALGVNRSEICGMVKSARVVEAKEVLILCGRRAGASTADLARLTSLNSSTVSRRHSIATDKTDRDAARKTQLDNLFKCYQTRIAILQD